MSERNADARATSLRILIIGVVVLAVAAVIADYPGRWRTGYGPLQHAEWDGIAAADLISPVLLFFLGAALPFARGPQSWGKIGATAAVTIAVGIVVSGYPRFDPSTWRLPGVLQRAGICYLTTAAASRLTSGDAQRRRAIFVSAATFLAMTYWLVMVHVPVPGGTPGDLSLQGNLAAWVDRQLMPHHLWSTEWDPDGLLSTIASTATTLFGLAAGVSVAAAGRVRGTAWQLGGAGAAAIVAGVLWSQIVPINRTLWSSSFVVFGAGVASMLFGAWSMTMAGERTGGRARAR